MNATVKKPAGSATGKPADAKVSISRTGEKSGAKLVEASEADATFVEGPDPALRGSPPSDIHVGAHKEHPEEIQRGKHMSGDNADAGSQDKIDKTAVSKVTEVATKTPKSASANASDGATLSEAQLMKMGEKDYMNAAQLGFFKARLQQLERDLLKNAGETTEHLRETVLVPDPADRATIEEEHALELRTRDRERKLLKKVQQSIASIDGGEYGWCEETGEPIGIPRLLARPTATLSLEAQQRRELKQKLYGD